MTDHRDKHHRLAKETIDMKKPTSNKYLNCKPRGATRRTRSEKRMEMGERRGRIWRLLAVHPLGLSPKQIAQALDLSYAMVWNDLQDMVGIENIGYGEWTATEVTMEWKKKCWA